MHWSAGLIFIVAVTIGISCVNSNPLDREIGNASITIEHFHQDPRNGNKYYCYHETYIINISGSGILDPLDREIGNASIQMEHYHPDPKNGNKYYC